MDEARAELTGIPALFTGTPPAPAQLGRRLPRRREAGARLGRRGGPRRDRRRARRGGPRASREREDPPRLRPQAQARPEAEVLLARHAARGRSLRELRRLHALRGRGHDVRRPPHAPDDPRGRPPSRRSRASRTRSASRRCRPSGRNRARAVLFLYGGSPDGSRLAARGRPPLSREAPRASLRLGGGRVERAESRALGPRHARPRLPGLPGGRPEAPRRRRGAADRLGGRRPPPAVHHRFAKAAGIRIAE